VSTQGPLHGVTVVDLGQIYNGPYATLLMALAGAEVIKVEPPRGDHLRSRGRVEGAGSPFVMLNSNKRGVTLDLKQPAGLELLDGLVAEADVLVENFRPGVTHRLGLGSERMMGINPRLIYASGSGFGADGPYRDYPAMDLTIQAIAGIMSVTGFPDRAPVKAGPAISDFMGGIHLYAGIVTALAERHVTGRGAVVDVAMFDAVYPSLMSSLGLFFGATGEIPSRTGNRHAGLAESPYNTYEVADGYVSLICVSDRHWVSLCHEMGRPELAEDPRFATRVGRVQRMDEVDELVAGWVRPYGKEELFKLLREVGVPCAPVREISEVVADPHLRQRGMLQELEHPEMGTVTVPHSPLRVGDHREALRPSPGLGQDNRTIYGARLGLSEERLDELEREGVI
jgi:CoA:oxalate CoA-transferase